MFLYYDMSLSNTINNTRKAALQSSECKLKREIVYSTKLKI